jgi:hypothetical protein
MLFHLVATQLPLSDEFTDFFLFSVAVVAATRRVAGTGTKHHLTL